MKKIIEYIEEELSLFEFSEKFLFNNDFETPDIFDITDKDIEIETLDATGSKIFKKINKFIVKPKVNNYYTDGKLKATSNHIIIENNQEIHIKDHPDFKKIDDQMFVVDLEVDDLHTYLANGRLNHNTTTGGQAIPYTASVRLRLKKLGQIKGKINGVESAIGERIQVQIVKNRLGPPRRKITFDVRYDSGIDNYGSWLTALKELGALSSSGSSYSYKYIDEETGEEITKKFQSKDFKKLLTENPELKEMIYNQICDAYIMKYEIGDEGDEIGIDDVVLSAGEEFEE